MFKKLKNTSVQMFSFFALTLMVFGLATVSNAQSLLNEVVTDPPGTDQPCEYIEIKWTPGMALNNLYIVGVEGDGIPSGTADYVFAFSGQTVGSNGLALVRAATQCGTRTYPAATTQIIDPALDASNGLENGSLSVLLISSPTAIVQGTDYDTDNDGTLESLPPGAVIVDGVAWTDGGTGDIAYGPAILSTTAAQDAATRFPGNTTPGTAAAFYSGFLTDDGNGNATVTYSETGRSANFPSNGMLTPGNINVGSPVAPSGTKRSDFDGDGRSDIAVFRPSNGTWYVQGSSVGFRAFNFGASDDKLVPGDYDGDGKTDYAVYRPSTGFWFVQGSTSGFMAFNFGALTDKPVPGDYDGDGKTDYAVYRPSTGFWYIQGSNTGFRAFNFGAENDRTVPGDYDGDGKFDIAVYRPNGGFWFIQGSTSGFMAFQFGTLSDTPVYSDFDGDGKTDIAVFRSGTGIWYIQGSTSGFRAFAFGFSSDIPVPADYDGDGKADIAVFRESNGTWYIQGSTSGFSAFVFGFGTDKTIQNTYISNGTIQN